MMEALLEMQLLGPLIMLVVGFALLFASYALGTDISKLGNLEVQSLNQTPGFFRGTLLATLLWAAPSAWMVCL